MKQDRSAGKLLGLSVLAALALALSGCNPLSGSPSTQSGFNPGIPTPNPTATQTPFTTSYTLNSSTSSSFSYDSSEIDFTGSAAELALENGTDQDDTANGFGGGTLTGVTWDSSTDPGSPYLRLGQGSTATNNSELDESWTPEWSHILGVWHLDETSRGTAPGGTDFADSSGQNHNLVITGGATPGEPGHLSDAANFTGSSYASGGWGNLTGDSPRTLMAWFKTTSTANCALFGWGTVTTNEMSSIGWWDSDISFLSYGTGISVPGVNFADGNWHQLVASFDGTTMTLYFDGNNIGSGTLNLSTGSSNIFLGSWQISDLQYTGLLDEVAVWDVGLSASEVAAIYSRQSVKYSGTFTSRVMDAFSSGQSWNSLSWMPTLPFDKELPDNGVSESGYPSETTGLMSGIAGLWHLDEPAGTTGAGTVLDASGKGNNGTPEGGVTFGSSGKLGTSASFNGSSGYVSIPNSTSTIGDLGNTLSVSAWVFPTSLGGRYGVFSTRSSNSPNSWQLEVGTGEGSDTNSISVTGVGTYVLVTNNNALTLNAWNHIVYVRNGVDNDAIYVNGLAQSFQVTTPYTFVDNTSAKVIGSGTSFTELFPGSIDEIAVWNRALTQPEALELYRRGVNRLKYQIRTCTAANAGLTDCTDGSTWQGPDSTNETYFSELYNTLANAVGGAVQAGLPSMLFSNFAPTLSVSSDRYFQYRAIFESDDTGTGCDYDSGATWCSPELSSVSASPNHYDPVSTVSNSTGQSYVTLSGFTDTEGSCTPGVAYDLSKDGSTWYYWNGSAWTAADGTASKASAAAVINANLASFPAQVGTGTLYFKAFLQSDGTTACQLSGVTVSGTD